MRRGRDTSFPPRHPELSGGGHARFSAGSGNKTSKPNFRRDDRAPKQRALRGPPAGGAGYSSWSRRASPETPRASFVRLITRKLWPRRAISSRVADALPASGS